MLDIWRTERARALKFLQHVAILRVFNPRKKCGEGQKLGKLFRVKVWGKSLVFLKYLGNG